MSHFSLGLHYLPPIPGWQDLTVSSSSIRRCQEPQEASKIAIASIRMPSSGQIHWMVKLQFKRNRKHEFTLCQGV
jgi:hypothetical protein